MKKSVLLIAIFSTLLFANFSRSGNIVTDHSTGLMWEDQSSIKKANWKDAINYCENLRLDGYSNWHLPNINELRSIVDYDRYDPAIDPTFKNTKSSDYWTNTTVKWDSSISWVLNFYYGNGYYHNRSGDFFVRYVR